MKKIFTLIAVAMLALAAQAENLTICGGVYYSGSIPVYGLWYDTPGMSQMIYPADSLTEMAGGEITELTFYTLANVQMEGQDFSSYVINFYDGKLTLSLMEVEQGSFTEMAAIEGAQVVATLVPEQGGLELKFVLDEPFAYHGGNLLVQVDVTEPGVYGTTYFWGTASEDENTPNYTYFENYNYSGDFQAQDLANFLARVTFGYTSGNKYYVCGGFNGWNAEEPLEITADGATFDAVQTDDPECLEFKLLTPGENDWIWIGGISENEGVEYFDITQGMIDDGIEITIYTEPEGKNFRLPAAGNYTIQLVEDTESKAAVDNIKMIVTKNNPISTAVNDITAKTVAGVKYVNLAGAESNKPFDGVNIMVTTYTDGTKSAAKVIK